MFDEVFTAIVFDEDKDYLYESLEYSTYGEAIETGKNLLLKKPEVKFFAVEKYYKWIDL